MTRKSVREQWAVLKTALALVVGVPFAILVIAGIQPIAPVWMLMRDPVSIAELPPYTGAISSMGVFLWCAAASISLFAALVLRRTGDQGHRSPLLFWGGCLSLLLMFDDFFTVHEVLAYHLHIPDHFFTATYGALALAYLVRFRDVILQTDYLLLATAFLFLGLSVVVDAVNPKDSTLLARLIGDRYHLVEDGPKFMGITAWLAYYLRVSWVELGMRLGIGRLA